jgi:AcrR family transcriptional regulator
VNATREKILDAAASIMSLRGLANTTTRQIATASGFSEATIYKHFVSKLDVMVAVLQERSSGFTLFTAALLDRSGSIEDRLAAIGRAAMKFYSANFPIFGSLFADPTVLAAHKHELREQGLGPHKINEAVMEYLRVEVEAGGMPPTTDVYAVTALFIGGCMQHAFLGLMGWEDRRSDGDAARSFARQLLAGA